jgi:hypothetical protein
MKKSELNEVDFDPGHYDWYLVDAASKLLSSFTPREIAEMLHNKYRIPLMKGLKAVEYARLYADDEKKKMIAEEDNYIDDMRRELRKAAKAKDAEQVVYYRQALTGPAAAVAGWDKFKGSWAYEQWLKKDATKQAIEAQKAEFKRFAYLGEQDESDYYSPEAKAARAAEKKETKPKQAMVGAYVIDLGLGNITPEMEKLGVVKIKKGGTCMLPYFPETNDDEFRQKIVVLDRITGRGGRWYDAKKKKFLTEHKFNTMNKNELRKLINEAVVEALYENALPQGLSAKAIIPLDKFVQRAEMTEAEADMLGAKTSALTPDEMQAYLGRVKNKTPDGPAEKYKMPYVHGSNIAIKDANNNNYDLDALKAMIVRRPAKILKQNEKMSKSAGENTMFYNIGLPALKGLAVNEKTGEFVVVDTCPGAGACKVYCYARKGGYIQYKDASMSQTRLLNYLLNDPQGFKTQFENELRKEQTLAQKKGRKIVIRWHDAGDFFSPEYLDLAYQIAKDFPDVDFYAYTKMASVATGSKPKNFIMNFSMGATPDQEKQIDFGKTKHSTVIPKPMFDKYMMKDEKGKLVRDEKNRMQFASDEDLDKFKADVAAKYKLDVDSIITYDEMLKTPVSDEANKYNVIIRPGDGDISASRADVKGTYLLIH